MLAALLALMLAVPGAAGDSAATLREVARFEPPEGAAALVEAAGVTVDALGHVWATDAGGHRLVRWDAGGRWLGEWGSPGSDPNQFRRPTAVTRLGSLGVAVLDVENRRVVAFDLLGRRTDLMVTLDAPDLEQLTGRITPVGLAADRGGALYVADGDRDRVLAFDFTGAYRGTIGAYGTGPGALHGIVGIAVASHGELVTIERGVPPAHRRRGVAADSAGAGQPPRVQWFDPSGSPLAAWSVAGATGMDVAVAVDDSGRVAVALAGDSADEVRLYARDGVLLARRTDVQSPRALAFAPDGTLLVAEAGGARVRRFALALARAE